MIEFFICLKLSAIEIFLWALWVWCWFKVESPPFRWDPNTLRCPSSRWLPSGFPPWTETQEKLLSNRYTHHNSTSTQRWYYPQGSCDEMSCDQALLTPPQPSHFDTRTQLCGKEESHSHIWQTAFIATTARTGRETLGLRSSAISSSL